MTSTSINNNNLQAAFNALTSAPTTIKYHHTRTLRDLAARTEQLPHLAAFWAAHTSEHPTLLSTHSTSAFALLDAHVLTSNSSGLLYWGKAISAAGDRLTPPLLKELLLSCTYNATVDVQLHRLLPVLSQLTTATDDNTWLPLPMSLLRKLASELAVQRRAADALALLRCVHPRHWPYDALLVALANEPGRVRDCEAVLRQRQEAVAAAADVGPLRGATARALLAMGVQQQHGDDRADVAAMRAVRSLVAKAVAQTSASESDRDRSRGAKADPEARRPTTTAAAAITEDEVQSGLVALLKVRRACAEGGCALSRNH